MRLALTRIVRPAMTKRMECREHAAFVVGLPSGGILQQDAGDAAHRELAPRQPPDRRGQRVPVFLRVG